MKGSNPELPVSYKYRCFSDLPFPFRYRKKSQPGEDKIEPWTEIFITAANGEYQTLEGLQQGAFYECESQAMTTSGPTGDWHPTKSFRAPFLGDESVTLAPAGGYFQVKFNYQTADGEEKTFNEAYWMEVNSEFRAGDFEGLQDMIRGFAFQLRSAVRAGRQNQQSPTNPFPNSSAGRPAA